MDSLWAQLRTAQTVDQVFSMCDAALRQRFGADTVDKAILGGMFLLIAFTLYVIWGIRKLFTQPAPMLECNKSNKSIANNKKQSSGKSGTSKASPAAAAEGLRGATAAEAAASPNSTVQAVRRSGRTRTQQVPPGGAAPLKGLPLLGVVACSPDGFLVLASSRDKRIVKAFPQFTELPKVAKDFKEAIELRDVPSDAIVTRVAFTSAGGVFALLDDVDAKVYLYRYNFDPDASPAAAPKLGMTFLRSVKVDATILAHRHEQCVLSDDASALYLMLQKEGTLDAIDLKTGAHIGSTKVKAGNTAAWAFAKDNKFAAAGSYMTDIRGYGVALRSGHTSGAVTLSKTFSCNTSAAATALLGSGAKVHRLAWSADASRLLVQYAGAPGLLELWATDVDVARDEVPTRLLGFADADFADCDTVTVTYYTAGSTSRRRDLIVVLIKGFDAVVYVVPRAHDPETFKDSTKAAPQLVLELHDPHDGEAIRWAGVGCRGTALVTGSESDGRNVVRLWPFVGSV